MNIEQYRAMKAQEAEASQTPDQTQPVTETKPAEVEQPKIEEPIVEEPKTEEIKLPEKVVIDGVGEVSFDDLRNGYLRQSDYTKKTQELSRKSKEVEDAVALFEHLKQNPQLAQKLLQTEELPASLDPIASQVQALQGQLFEMKIEREIETLQNKYPDFEVREVLQTAHDKKLTNLEDAYLLVKSSKKPSDAPVDMEAIKKQLRDEVLKELEKERTDTQTIITPNDTPTHIQDNTPKLSESEKKVARGMKLSEADYVKWRDAGIKKR